MKLIRPAVVSLVSLTILTGVAYPLVITGIARLAFPRQAGGSVVALDGKIVGSSLIAQPFTDPKYLWPRPSSAGTNGYDATASSGSNLGPTNPALTDAVKGRIEALHKADPGNDAPVPIDLVTASGSGLDPDISAAAARYQASRIAKARGATADDINRLIADHTSNSVLGSDTVNVLEINLALDQGYRR